MTIEPLRLDDLTWAGLMAAVRSHVPAESQGLWTLHAPVDPGITLLELFAWLLEQRVFWLDQVPDSLIRAVLRLLDLEAPRPARAASTVMAFDGDWRAGTTTTLSAGVELSRDPSPDVVFSLDADVFVLPVARIDLEVAGRDRTTDLAARTGVPILPADGGPGEARFGLWMSPRADPPAEGRISLLFVLDSPSQVPPQWSPDAVQDVPVPARLIWSYQAGGTLVEFDGDDVEDGTGGFRRSGVVRLPFPDEWRRGGGVLLDPFQPTRRVIAVRAEDSTFSCPPVLIEVARNAAPARHRRVARGAGMQRHLDDRARAWLRLPGQSLEIPDSKGQLLDDPGTIHLSIRERDGQWHPWESAQDFTFACPDHRVFVVDRDRDALRFGDGLTGRIPVVYRGPAPAAGTGPDVVVLQCELGGGLRGDVGSNLAWRVEGRPGLLATNVVDGVGGREPETVEESRARAAEELGRVTRAVTAGDYEALVRTTPGVALPRAYVGLGHHPSFPCARVPGAVTVYVVPFAPRGEDDLEAFVSAPEPDPGALEAVRGWLDRHRLVGTELFVRGPRYRHVRLDVGVDGRPAHPDGLRERLRAALGTFLDPLVGGDGTGWPFGGALRPSELLRRAQEAAGTAARVSSVAIWLDGMPPRNDCDDVEVGEQDLVVLDDLTLHVLPTLVQAGGLP